MPISLVCPLTSMMYPYDFNFPRILSCNPMSYIIHPLSYAALALGYRRQVAINVIDNHKTEKAGRLGSNSSIGYYIQQGQV